MEIAVTDEQWKRVADKMSRQGVMGRPRADDRRCLNAILYVLIVQSRREVVLGTMMCQNRRTYGTSITRVRPHDGGSASGDPI